MQSLRKSTRVAAAQYPIDRLSSWDHYRNKLVRWVEEACDAGAELLIFPEYAGMEMLSIVDRRAMKDRRSHARHVMGPLPAANERRRGPSLRWEAAVIQPMLPEYRALHAELARQHRVYVLAGSAPIRHS